MDKEDPPGYEELPGYDKLVSYDLLNIFASTYLYGVEGGIITEDKIISNGNCLFHALGYAYHASTRGMNNDKELPENYAVRKEIQNNTDPSYNIKLDDQPENNPNNDNSESEYSKKMSLYHKSNDYLILSNTSHFEYSKNLETKLNTKFNENAFKVFTVRSIEDRALINLLINIASILKDENIQFLVAGKGPMLRYYETEIKSLNLHNICLLGYISDIDLINHYKKCDVVLMPASYGEGFGLPIIEGYLFNKPVIASNVCAIPEVIFSDVFLFENNINDIISKLFFVKKSKKYDYYEYYSQKFSNDIVISKMINLYQRLM